MKVEEAILRSKDGVAQRLGRGTIVYAARTGAGIRIVKSFTDPTVVRQLNKTDLYSSDWRAA